jgi:hypothetical protein
MSLEDSLDRLEAAIDALIARAEGRDKDGGFRKGLTQGPLLSLLMLQARTVPPEAPDTAPAAAKSRRSLKEKIKRDQDQLDLFKP